LTFVLQLGLGLLLVSGNIKIAREQHVHKEVGIYSNLQRNYCNCTVRFDSCGGCGGDCRYDLNFGPGAILRDFVFIVIKMPLNYSKWDQLEVG
jgi:hypothetical protein